MPAKTTNRARTDSSCIVYLIGKMQLHAGKSARSTHATPGLGLRPAPH